MVLSNRQKSELDKAVLSYLSEQGFVGAFQMLRKEIGASVDGDAKLPAKYEKLLEKKWTAIVRLQKKIMRLEQKVDQLTEDLKNAGTGKKVDTTEALPREPAQHVLAGHRGPITQVVFHPVFSLIASSSEDCMVKLWDYESGQFERTIKAHIGSVQDIAFNTEGTVLATCSADLSIKLWETETYQNKKTMLGHDHNVSCVRFNPANSAVLVSASRDKTIRLWDTNTGYCTKTLTGHSEWVRQVRFSPNGELLASCSMDQTVRIWDAATGKCLHVLRDHDHVVETIEFSTSKATERLMFEALAEADGRDPSEYDSYPVGKDDSDENKARPNRGGSDGTGAFLVSGSRDKTIRVWEVSTGRLVKTLRSHGNWVRSIVFHPCGKYILSGADDKSIRIWDITKQYRNTRTIENAHPLFVSSIDWNRSFPVMASGGVDNTVRIWECR